PADVAGLQPDDSVVSIDGEPTAEVGHERRDAGAWENRLRGPSGTRVILGILRTGWHDPRPFTIVRAQVKQPTVRHDVLDKRIGYLAITRFSEATSSDVLAALTKLRQQGALDALVLDLRNDPGGLVDQAIAIADRRPVPRWRDDRHDPRPPWQHRDPGRSQGRHRGLRTGDRAGRSGHRVGGRDPRCGAPRSWPRDAGGRAHLRQGHRPDILR